MLAMIQGLPPEPIVYSVPGNAALIAVVAAGHVMSMILIGLAVWMAMRYRAPLLEGPPVPASAHGPDAAPRDRPGGGGEQEPEAGP